jgi:hypothetical protein
LKPKVEIIENHNNESSDNETDDNFHSIDIKPSKRTVTEAHGVETTRPTKKTRKSKKPFVGQSIKIKSKAVEKVPLLYNCLQETCDQKFAKIEDFEDRQIKHDSVEDVS